MPPPTKPLSASDGKWSMYVDKEDSFSPPPQSMRRKAKTKPRSKPSPKPPIPPTTDKEDSSSPPPQRKRLFHHYKANPNTTKNPDGDNENPPTPTSENPLLHEKKVSDADTPQDGKGDPNLSGITPPLPIDLVEPQLQAHDTGFHVITAGIEVGITTVRGIADSRLACQSPSTQIFSTWKQAKSYYSVCFNDGSVTIRPPLQNQTPIQSPVRKKRKVTSNLLERQPLPQPSFAPAFNTPKAKGSASQPINVSSTESTPATPHSTREYTPLYFPESPPALPKPAKGGKHQHPGVQAIPRNTNHASSPSGEYPELPIPTNHSGIRSPGQYPERVTPPSRSLGHIDPRNVYVESSSDEDAATDAGDNTAPTTTRPVPSSSHIVEVHGDPYHASSPIIVISDSEEETAPEIAWPSRFPRLTNDEIYELNMLFGLPNQRQRTNNPAVSGYRR